MRLLTRFIRIVLRQRRMQQQLLRWLTSTVMELLTTQVQISHNPLEFLIANMSPSVLVNDQILKRAFDFYDDDKNGYITCEELRKVFGPWCSEEQSNDMIKEVDLNGDEKVSFLEFKVMDYIKTSAPKYRTSWSIV